MGNSRKIPYPCVPQAVSLNSEEIGVGGRSANLCRRSANLCELPFYIKGV